MFNSVTKVKKSSILILLFLLSACQSDSSTSTLLPALELAPEVLTVGEGFVEPLGYYESTPRFSWKIAQASTLNLQTAYQIQVATDTAYFDDDFNGKNLEGTTLLWDSGKVQSNDTSWITYQGKALSSRAKVSWRVRQWGNNDQATQWSIPQTVELGLLNNTDWQAKWIGHPDTELDKNPSQTLLATPQYLRKDFTIKGEIASAKLYITAKGIFKPFINGVEVSAKDVMTPGWTPYAKRIESLTYDLTDHLVQGDNTLAANLAGGWYAGRVYKFTEKEHKLPARLLAQLEIRYKDGQQQIVTSDDTWLATQNGPIRFASIYDGERYDQSYEMLNWNGVGFDATNWQSVSATPLDDNVVISPKRHEPIRTTDEIAVESIVSHNNGTVVFDFGQNMVGVPKLSIPVVAGQEVKIRFAEALNKGEFYTENYRSAQSTDYYLPSKTGVITYQPTFTYHGYRYIEISGFDVNKTPEKSWATALIQHSDVTIHASFESSHQKLNKLSNNIVWGLRSNFFDIPLDCPQRDERLGWTGDAQVFATPSMYMADVYGFWSAWLQSVREEQGADGKIPLYIPFVEWINFASSGWGDAATIIPWELYIVTGDITILADNYDMMKGWIKYHEKKSKDLISNMTTFGDWLQPYPTNLADGENGNRGNTDFNLIGTAYFARSVQLTLKAAQALNKPADVATYTLLHDRIKQAFMQQFFNENLDLKKGVSTQTTYLLGLAYDLFPDEKRSIAVDKLIALIKEADSHLRTGFLGTPLLTQVLQEAGRSDVIYDLLFKETYPSWFYSINNGATTTWERWNSYSIEEGFNPQGMNSLNHYAYGTVSRWFYEGILGIKPAEPGFKTITIEPQFGHQLNQASGSYTTPQGTVKVNWTTQNQQLNLTLSVPKNTLANIVLPKVAIKKVSFNGQFFPVDKLKDLQPGEYQLQGNFL